MENVIRPKISPGYRLGKLTVSSPTDRRKNGYTIWHCVCDCGESIELDTRTLQRGTKCDCGCVTKLPPGAVDLSGQRFGKLVAIAPTDKRQYGGVVWKCICDCGNVTYVSTHQLSCGYTKSCGCLGHPPLKDYIGKRFGQLTVISYAGKRDGLHMWRCRCDCGTEAIVGQTNLQSGWTKSCGCLARPPMQKLIGKRFGHLSVVAPADKVDGQYMWHCRCDCGMDVKVRQFNLISGHVKSCGCLRSEIIRQRMKFVDGTSIVSLERAKTRLIASNTSGFNGIYQNKRNGRWVAQITFKSKTYYLGTFIHIEDAVKARKRGEEMYDSFLAEHNENGNEEICRQ